MASLLKRLLCGLVAAWMVAAAPAQAEWRRAESPNFVVYGNMTEARLRERILLLEDFNRLLRMLASADERPAPKLHVYVIDRVEDLRIVWPVPDNVGGYYISTNEGIAAFVVARAEGRGNEILLHEYTHHFMRQHMRNAYPIWYVEGFAEYFSTVRFTARTIDIGNFSRGRMATVMEPQWLPIERVLGGGIDGLNPEAVSLFYAQSWLLVHYFYSTPDRQRALARLLAALRRGGDVAAALEMATGLNPRAFTEELRRYIRGGSIAYRQAPRGSVAAQPQIAVATMPRAAGDMILYEAALRIGIAEANRQPYLQRIRAIAARHPDDPFAMRVLAHAELLHGDGANADRLLDRLLAAAPNEPELLYLKGMGYLVAAERPDPPEGALASARSWFARARAADPHHFQTLIGYARSMRGATDAASAETRDMLLQAAELAPQVASIALNAASVLIARGEYQEALRLLAPLVVNPHDAAVAAAARQLLEQAMGQMNRRRPIPSDPQDDEDMDAPVVDKR